MKQVREKEELKRKVKESYQKFWLKFVYRLHVFQLLRIHINKKIKFRKLKERAGLIAGRFAGILRF